MKKLLLAISCVGWSALSAQIYVDQSATGVQNGSSWANAYTELQDALDAAVAGDEIWVAQGVYIPPQEGRTAAFITGLDQDGLKLIGGFGGTETDPSERIIGGFPTILSGDKLANDFGDITAPDNPTRTDNCYNVVIVQSDDVTIDGFNIQNGHANGPSLPFQNGAAIRKTQAPDKLTVRNCFIAGNYSFTSGSGIFFWIDSPDSELIVEKCVFALNRATWATGIYAVALDVNANATLKVSLIGNVFTQNQAVGFNSFGASALWARSLAADGLLTVEVINNTFYSNIEEINSNDAVFRTTVGVDGFEQQTVVNYVNNISHANTSPNGQEFSQGVSAILGNGTLGNSEFSAVQNNLLDISPNSVQVANIFTDENIVNAPTFVNVDAGDLSLAEGSAGIDWGWNPALPEDYTTDINGAPRIFNENVDLGAAEFQNPLSIGQSLEEMDFELYPNPVDDLLTIGLKEFQEVSSITVFDLTGKSVLETQYYQLDVSQLKSGLYLLRMTTKTGEQVTKRFVKN